MRKKSAAGLVVLMLCALMGCGKKEVDYVDSTEGQNGEIQTVTESTVAVSDEDIPEQLEYTITGDKGTIEVAAEVKLPEDYERCTVMELADDTLEDEDIKAMADKVFDEGSYFLYMPYNMEEIEYLRDKLTTASENAANEDETKIFEATLNGFNDEEALAEVDEAYEELKFYPDHRTDDGGYFCRLFGSIDGRYYLMTFEKDDKNSSINIRRWDRTVQFQLNDVPADGIDMNLSGNASTYSQEESEEIAEEFVKKLGYDQYDVAQTNNTMFALVDGGLGEIILEPRGLIEGYNVYLGRSYNNYSMTYSSESWIMAMAEERDYYGEYKLEKFENSECVRVYVDSQGVCDFKIYNPMQEVGPMNEEIVFQSFDKVDSIAQEEMQKLADNNSGKYKIDSVELGYGIVNNDGKKALIPVWYYFGKGSTTNSNFYQKNALVLINALDGTVIKYE